MTQSQMQARAEAEYPMPKKLYSGLYYTQDEAILKEQEGFVKGMQEMEGVVEALEDAITRMDRAREILHKPVVAEWNMLNTDSLKQVLSTIFTNPPTGEVKQTP